MNKIERKMDFKLVYDGSIVKFVLSKDGRDDISLYQKKKM